MDIDRLLQDFRRDYSNTYAYVVLPKSKEEVLAHIVEINRNDDIATINLATRKQGTLSIVYGSNYKLKFKYPPVGVFQHGLAAFYLDRLTNKQFVRGLSPSNAYIGQTTKLYKYSPTQEWDLDIVQSAFDQTTFGLHKAMEMLTKKHNSVALVDGFSIANLSHKKYKKGEAFFIFYYANLIAIIDKDRKPIDIQCQELYRFFEKTYYA